MKKLATLASLQAPEPLPKQANHLESRGLLKTVCKLLKKTQRQGAHQQLATF
jgi:hypothetical protein